MKEVYNFSPGPGVLFKDVLHEVNSEFLNWNDTGHSVLELNHRTDAFKKLLLDAMQSLKTLANIPDDFDILFVQGGATQIFSSIPLNFCEEGDTVDYIVNGYWSRFAANEAKKFAKVKICNHAPPDGSSGKDCPNQASLKLSPNAKYVHYCCNETISGCEFQYVPEVGEKPLICDMSSNFLSKPIHCIEKYGMIYAGCHKNVGPPGMAVVIVRKDMLNKYRNNIPLLLNFTQIKNHNSTLNTPPVFNIYFAKLTFEYMLKQGGLSEMEKNNKEKAKLLYDAIENSDGFYLYDMNPSCKSIMNVPFRLKNSCDETVFLQKAKEFNIIGLEGHSSVGHCRASLYNAMPIKGVEHLVEYMDIFHKMTKKNLHIK